MDGLVLSLDVVDTLLDRGVLARLGNLGDPGGHGIQINVRTCRQQCFLIENRHALEAGLPKGTPTLILSVRPT
jgi:hypothetical protein